MRLAEIELSTQIPEITGIEVIYVFLSDIISEFSRVKHTYVCRFSLHFA